MLGKIDENTYGKKGQIVSTTKVEVVCDSCGDTWSSNYYAWKTKSNKPDICQSCQNRLGISGMKGKSHSEAYKSMMSKTLSGDSNPAKRPEVRKKISQKLKGRATPWNKGKKRPEHAKKMKKHMLEVWSTDNEYRRKLLKAGNNKHSKLHDQIKSWLTENVFLSLLSEQLIPSTKFIVDEVDFDKKVVVEINGDFWHANPNIYEAEDKLPHLGGQKYAKDIWERDHKRRKLLEQLGYRVITIWESDWKDKNKRNKIKREINKL